MRSVALPCSEAETSRASIVASGGGCIAQQPVFCTTALLTCASGAQVATAGAHSCKRVQGVSEKACSIREKQIPRKHIALRGGQRDALQRGRCRGLVRPTAATVAKWCAQKARVHTVDRESVVGCPRAQCVQQQRALTAADTMDGVEKGSPRPLNVKGRCAATIKGGSAHSCAEDAGACDDCDCRKVGDFDDGCKQVQRRDSLNTPSPI